ncbi:10954_t:CDS:2 [Ambispora gerdemannii]|uniref:10954_t:CDS:1 n=1 Tax=Ambispora gerdemannii TaxID=144530 RepID=A0A9N8VWS4_9GLOM|nr:10954_t:CDS:2 [Ambispora gerdemannii]
MTYVVDIKNLMSPDQSYRIVPKLSNTFCIKMLNFGVSSDLDYFSKGLRHLIDPNVKQEVKSKHIIKLFYGFGNLLELPYFFAESLVSSCES